MEQVPPPPAGRNSRQAFDEPQIRITFPKPFFTAHFPLLVRLQSQRSWPVTRFLLYECEVVEMGEHSDLPLVVSSDT